MSPILTVNEITDQIDNSLKHNFPSSLKIMGEISNLSSKGGNNHTYFDLIDDGNNKKKGKIKVAYFSFNYSNTTDLKLENGLSVICTGSVGIYKEASYYQLKATKIELAGLGKLLALQEEKKRKLAQEGLFDPSRKKKLPEMPRVIGVITSINGAVIKDIINRITDRFPTHIIIWDVQVQGKDSANQIVQAINGFNHLLSQNKDNYSTIRLNKTEDEITNIKKIAIPEVIIIARGGGSMEEIILTFNDENVIRAAANSVIPIISAIGHETDNPFLDFAADIRAATPTAAAEIAVPAITEKMGFIQEKLINLKSAWKNFIKRKKLNFENINIKRLFDDFYKKKHSYLAERKISHKVITLRISRSKDLLQQKLLKLEMLRKKVVTAKDTALQYRNGLLDSVNYMKTMKRGFAIIQDNNRVIKTVDDLTHQQEVTIQLHDGNRKAVVKKSS